MKRELEDECDYIREAESGRRFHRLLKGYPYFKVPQVVDEASTSKVLTVEWMTGKALSRVKGLSQADRDAVSTTPSLPTMGRAHETARREYPPIMPAGALRIQIHANRPQLGKLPIRWTNP
jgi:hypothetical protein